MILAFGHNGYLGSNSIKWIGFLTNALLVDSFLQNLSYAFAYSSGSIAYLSELMHLLGKSHGAVKNDIQNKINDLLRSGKRRRDTRDDDNIPLIQYCNKNPPGLEHADGKLTKNDKSYYFDTGHFIANMTNIKNINRPRVFDKLDFGFNYGINKKLDKH